MDWLLTIGCATCLFGGICLGNAFGYWGGFYEGMRFALRHRDDA